MRRLIRAAAILFAASFVIAAPPLMAESPEPAILDRDEKPLFPQLKKAADINDRAAGILGSKDFKLVKVEALQGQNPFDPIEPFFNLDGERVDNFDELQNLLANNNNNNNNNNGNFADCIGTFTSGQVLIGGAVAAEFSILINEAAGTCQVFFSTDGESLGLILLANDNDMQAFAFGGFTLLQPAGGRLAFGPQTIRTRNNATGTVFVLQLNTTKTSNDPPEFQITINSIAPE